MQLVEPDAQRSLPGIEVPERFYWVLNSPTPLGGMRAPGSDFPWSSLAEARFSKVVSLEPGHYKPDPLEVCFEEKLEDLVGGGPPADEDAERAKVQRAVTATVEQWRSGHGVVVHCHGGRGRTGTVLACSLRELGFQADTVIDFLDRLHIARQRPGWPESVWQSALVRDWQPGASGQA